MNLFGDSLKKKLKDAEVEFRKPALFYEGDLYFQITEDRGSLVLKVVNKKGQVVTDYLAENYPVNLRNVLHFYRFYKARDAEMVYLADNPSIIRLITLCDNLVNGKMETIEVKDVALDVYLHISFPETSSIRLIPLGQGSRCCTSSYNRCLRIRSINTCLCFIPTSRM